METAVLRVQTCWYADRFSSWRMLSDCRNCCPDRRYFFTIIQNLIIIFFLTRIRKSLLLWQDELARFNFALLQRSSSCRKKTFKKRQELFRFMIGSTSFYNPNVVGGEPRTPRLWRTRARRKENADAVKVRSGAAVWREGGDSWHINANIHIKVQNSDTNTAKRHLNTRYLRV